MSETAASGRPTSNLPIIDVQALHAADQRERLRVAQDIGDAARQSGFFYVVGHGIQPGTFASLRKQAKALFDLPLKEKMELYIGLSKNHRGYVPQGEEVFAGGTNDRKEAFDLGFELPEDDPDVLAGTPTLGPNVWPGIEGFREEVSAYYRAALDLGHTLFRGFALALGLPEHYFDQFLTKPPSQFRLIHYPYDPQAKGESGIGAHTDYECFTILHTTAPGLQVMSSDGEWVDAPPVEGALVVNIGDMLEVWTNGEFVATSHRVRRVEEERYSFPLFCLCDYHTVVKPLPAFVTPERPARYEPIVAGAHLFSQTAQSFRYLKERVADGSLGLPAGARTLSSFGQESRHRAKTGGV